MTLLSENPWPIIGLLLAIGFISFLTAAPRSGTIFVVCVLLSVGLFFLEKYLVSPAERVQAAMHVMLENFKSRDIAAIGNQLSDNAANLKDVAQRGLDLVELSESFHIRSADVTMESETRAVVMVRANGSVTLLRHSGGSRHVATYWKTIWIKDGGDWKLDEVTRLNVANGEEVDTFSTSRNSPSDRNPIRAGIHKFSAPAAGKHSLC